MTTNYNKFKNTQINDTNSLGYALSISGNLKLNNDNVSTIYSNQIYDYNNNYYLTSSNLFNVGTSLEAAFNNVAVGNYIGCGNLNSSNSVNCVSLKITDIICKTIVADDIFLNGIYVGI